MERNKESALDTLQDANRAGLRYINDNTPGYYRIKKGKGFYYTDADGQIIKDEVIKARIKKLVIPPAWKKVWISPFENSHLQATGLDARMRKQYKYHPQWSKSRNETKFYRILEFAAVLPKLRQQAEKDLKRRKLDKNKVLGAIIHLMEKSTIRVGNKEYARDNKSYGLTTLRDRHVVINGEDIHFEFVGKKGIPHKITLRDGRLASIVRKCRDIPGYELFQYYDEQGERRCIDSGDVNRYIQSITGKTFTAKDFRTWSGTLAAFSYLRETEPAFTFNKKKRQVNDVLKSIAKKLGNTTTVCKQYYVHPILFESFMDGSLHIYLKKCREIGPEEDIVAWEEEMLTGFLRVSE